MDLTRENTGRFVQTGGVRIHYHEAGVGPVLLCIHGGAPGAFGWGNFGRNLPALAANFRTLIVDLPGYGLSDKPLIEGPRTGFYTRCFLDMLDTLGIAQAHVLGMATGGAVAIKMALESPQRIHRLVLVSSAGSLSLFQPGPPKPASHDYYSGEGPSMARMRAIMERLVYDKSLLTDEVIRERYEASIEPAFMAQAPEGQSKQPGANIESLWQELHLIQSPTLVIWGRDNPGAGFDHALFMLARIPDVRVQLHSRCGLWVPFEKAEEFNRNVTSFLSLPA